MQARYYDPVIGRFYSNDPVGYTAKNPVMSFNRYLYVNNNPYKYTDPSGEFLFILFVPLAEYTASFIAADLVLATGYIAANTAYTNLQEQAMEQQDKALNDKALADSGDYKAAFSSSSGTDASYQELAESVGTTAEVVAKAIPGNTTSGSIPTKKVDAKITAANGVKDEINENFREEKF
ncbi:RHS repeat-associated core domain-containing protein [Psychrosphaera sp. F3M07]|uniref:RHS repeat-associated core domain-containing protein n=1 Tax=Psychrosphaera sp. F3M07 TaxID=2841560 RepID=UPI00209098C7|nr:RHS repeat-associated core domain-containing protein [Psychrosphaera sp. F3M07]